MPLPVVFAQLPQGDNPASLLDTQFTALAGFVFIPCAATGQNVIQLEPFADAPLVNSYTDLAPVFTFQAAQSCTGNVTINVSGLGEAPAFKANGGALVQAGDILAGLAYQATWLTALNGGAGGFVLNIFGGGSPIPPPPPGVDMVTMFFFFSTATFVPPLNMTSCIVEGQGGGGGGGSALADGTNGLGGGGGGSGGFFKAWLTPTQVGTSQTVTIGTGGAPGQQGGNTSFGVLATGQGGFPGLLNDGVTSGGVGGQGGTGSAAAGVPAIGFGGNPGLSGDAFFPAVTAAGNQAEIVHGGAGGGSYGGGGAPTAASLTTFQTGNDGFLGGGGSGAVTSAATGGSTIPGGRGGPGWCVIQAFS